MPDRACIECGAALSVVQRKMSRYHISNQTRRHCNSKCKDAWNMRRRKRGAELYDFVMAWRFERAEATEQRFQTAVCALASKFRQEDREQRDGRMSWDVKSANQRVNYHMWL